jgi:hypothetical protein
MVPAPFYNQSLLHLLCPDLSSLFLSGEQELKESKTEDEEGSKFEVDDEEGGSYEV